MQSFQYVPMYICMYIYTYTFVQHTFTKITKIDKVVLTEKSVMFVVFLSIAI